MSALAGILIPSSSSPDLELRVRLARSLASRGPDGVASTAVPEVAMIHAALRLVPGPLPEPFLRRGPLLLAWDGRLDNRPDLEAALEIRAGASDLELLALAYERWGTAFPARIVGDFALALWDGRERRLLLARDPFAVRPLFYVPWGEGLVWASTLRALRRAGAPLGEVDEEWIAGYFSRSIDPATTPWQKARAVPPGGTLVVEGGRIRSEIWWRAEEAREVRFGSDAEYEERFRELFLQAVRRRLRAAEPVTAELSGGLDSSSIVCAADHLLRAGDAEAPDLLTVSFVYERSTSADERRFGRAVEEHTGRRFRHVLEGEAPRLTGLFGAASEIPSALPCFRELYRTVFDFMGGMGSRVLLSGLAGDHLLTSQVSIPYQLADLLQARDLKAFFAALRDWRAEQHKPYLQLLWEAALCPLLPRSARLRLAPPPIPLPPWLDRRFIRRQDLATRFLAAVDPEVDVDPPSKREQVAAVRSVIRGVSWMYDWWDAPVQMAFPFLDRDLVELCLGIPSGQIVRRGETRSLLRRSLAGLLPPRIARRQDKQGPDEAVLRALGERWGEIRGVLDEPRVVARGWIDPAAFQKTLQEARFGKPGTGLPGLLGLLGLEAWLRAYADA